MTPRGTILLLTLCSLAAAGLIVWWTSPAPSPGTDAGAPRRPEADASTSSVPTREHPADRNFNPGWIGAACSHDADCDYQGGFCLMPEEGFPRGYCSARCRRLCPDRKGDRYSTTLCIEDPAYGDEGICVAGCNLHLTPSGCRPGYRCTTQWRLGDETVRMVCLPERGTPSPPTACTRQLDRLGLTYARIDLADAPSRPARPGDPLPRRDHCQIDTPVLLASPVRTVDYRLAGERHAEHLVVACRLALVLERFSDMLREAGVVEVEHAGTYVCRSVAGTRTLSGHGHALAIDVTGFERARAAPVSVARDWNRPGEERRFLRNLVRDLRKAGIFDVVLTPAYDQAHADHLHLEIHPP